MATSGLPAGRRANELCGFYVPAAHLASLRGLSVETQMVVYEREGHRFVNPAHIRDLIERTAAWFAARLK